MRNDCIVGGCEYEKKEVDFLFLWKLILCDCFMFCGGWGGVISGIFYIIVCFYVVEDYVDRVVLGVREI